MALTVWNAYYVLDTVEHFMYVASFDLHEDPLASSCRKENWDSTLKCAHGRVHLEEGGSKIWV